MALLTTPENPTTSARLTAPDWTECALTVLKEAGLEAVQITTLAKQLKVTRGSFYWHFDSREDLLNALLAEWRARNTGVMVDAIRDVGSLDDGILALFSVWVDHTRFDPRLDQAIRDWARHDERLRNIVTAEDDARVGAIARFFERFDYPENEAFIRARVIYFTQISYFALHVEDGETLTQRMGYLDENFLCFTGRVIDPDTANTHRSMIERSQNDHAT